mgnify:CR=1 FL=1
MNAFGLMDNVLIKFVIYSVQSTVMDKFMQIKLVTNLQMELVVDLLLLVE